VGDALICCFGKVCVVPCTLMLERFIYDGRDRYNQIDIFDLH
jgi:hypothetical protein